MSINRYVCLNCGDERPITDTEFMQYRKFLRKIREKHNLKFTPSIAALIEDGIGCCDKPKIMFKS